MVNMFDIQADEDFVIGNSKKRYEILKEAMSQGMSKVEALRLYDSLHIPDKDHDLYLEKLMR